MVLLSCYHSETGGEARILLLWGTEGGSVQRDNRSVTDGCEEEALEHFPAIDVSAEHQAWHHERGSSACSLMWYASMWMP